MRLCVAVALLRVAIEAFPTLPHKNDGRRAFELIALEAVSKADMALLPPQAQRSRLAGVQEPILLYAQGPYNWPAIGLRVESDTVLDTSGVVGW
jgi:hypothetical protein